MSNENERIPGAENPDKLSGLKLGSIKKTAAGMPGIMAAFKQAFGEAGVARLGQRLDRGDRRLGADRRVRVVDGEVAGSRYGLVARAGPDSRFRANSRLRRILDGL